MMNPNLFIHTHLGLGDHFIVCGLVRHIISLEQYDWYYIGCKERNYISVEPLYRDLKNVKILRGANETADISLYSDLPEKCDVLRVGHEYLNPSIDFDKSFYAQLGIPFKYKRSKFHVNRDVEREDKCFDELVKSGGDYIFVHDKTSIAEYSLKTRTDIPIIKPINFDYSIPDYLKIIENAKEVHCVDSSFLNFIEVALDRNNLFFHDVRVMFDPQAATPNVSEKWTIINYENN